MKIYTFKVELEGYEELYRIIQVKSDISLADLVYMILASFNSLAFQKFKIYLNNKLYVQKYNNEKKIKNEAKSYFLEDEIENIKKELYIIYLNAYNKLKLNVYFIKENEVDNKIYPRVIEGKGFCFLEGKTAKGLKRIIEKSRKDSNFKYFYNTNQGNKLFEYDKFNLEENNEYIKKRWLRIKERYEIYDTNITTI